MFELSLKIPISIRASIVDLGILERPISHKETKIMKNRLMDSSMTSFVFLLLVILKNLDAKSSILICILYV